MTAVVDYYSDEHKSLQQQLVIHVSQEADSLYAQGCIILLKYCLLSCELMLSQAEAKFSPYVTLPKLPDLFHIVRFVKSLSQESLMLIR